MKKYSVQPQLTLHNQTFGDPNDRGEEKILIGKFAESGPNQNIYFDVSGERVVGIFGKRGCGKSFSLASLIEGFFCKERGTLLLIYAMRNPATWRCFESVPSVSYL